MAGGKFNRTVLSTFSDKLRRSCSVTAVNVPSGGAWRQDTPAVGVRRRVLVQNLPAATAEVAVGEAEEVEEGCPQAPVCRRGSREW